MNTLKMPELRIIIAGTRTFDDYGLLEKEVSRTINRYDRDKGLIKIISGGAKGADTLGERFAKEKGYEIKRFLPDWECFGKKAGYLRNAEMACYSGDDGNEGVLIAFWDGESKGTKLMIDLAHDYGLDINVILY